MSGGRVEAYCEASHCPDWNDPRAVIAYIFLLNGGPVSWYSRRQAIPTNSTTEPELVALTTATIHAIWLRNLIVEVDLMSSNPVMVYCDNKGAVLLSKNANFSPRTKHLFCKYAFMQDRIKSKEIDLKDIGTKDMIADAFTKIFPKDKFQIFLANINML